MREPDEYEQGALAGSIHLPRGNLESSVEGRIPDKSAHVLVLCAGGVRSAFAADTMQQLGYTDVASIMGGFNRWKDEDRVMVRAPHPLARAAQPLPAPPAPARGR